MPTKHQQEQPQKEEEKMDNADLPSINVTRIDTLFLEWRNGEICFFGKRNGLTVDPDSVQLTLDTSYLVDKDNNPKEQICEAIEEKLHDLMIRMADLKEELEKLQEIETLTERIKTTVEQQWQKVHIAELE